MVGTAEVALGTALILVGVYLGWAARPGNDGRIRRVMMRPGVDEYFPLLLMGLLLSGTCAILVGFGMPIGTGGSIPQ